MADNVSSYQCLLHSGHNNSKGLSYTLILMLFAVETEVYLHVYPGVCASCCVFVCIHICTNLQPSACNQPGCRSSSHILHWAGRWWWWPTGSWQPAEHSRLNTAPHWSENKTHTQRNSFNLSSIYSLKVYTTPHWLTTLQQVLVLSHRHR